MPAPGNSPWPNRLAWALALCTFPLIWVGGLVTTYRAGMAVPDWPSTFGYWLYYPLQSWFAVWDVFLEHSHRVIGMVVGSLTVALAIVLWRGTRPALRWLGVVALGGVCFQGTLGGLRVIQNEVLLANIHGCTAPLFFSLAAALVTLTSRTWQTAGTVQAVSATRLQRLLPALATLLYLQIVIGAQMRHLPSQAALAWFGLWVWLHLINATLILTGIAWLLKLRGSTISPLLRRRIALLSILYAVQLVLGGLTWLAKYGWPAWAAEYVAAVNYTVVTGGKLQGLMTSIHVGVGALCLAAAVTQSLWARRLLRPLRTSA